MFSNPLQLMEYEMLLYHLPINAFQTNCLKILFQLQLLYCEQRFLTQFYMQSHHQTTLIIVFIPLAKLYTHLLTIHIKLSQYLITLYLLHLITINYFYFSFLFYFAAQQNTKYKLNKNESSSTNI